jgi:hypothetical protein
MMHAPNRAHGAESLPPDSRVRLALYALISIAALIPLAIVEIPPLVDYPNHLARLHVIANIGTDPALAANYRVVWGAMPNLALEAATFPLMALLPVEIVGRLFIAVTFILLAGGTLWLHRLLHGSIGLWPAAVWLFLYNHLLVMGFLGYLFTLGAAPAFALPFGSSRRGCRCCGPIGGGSSARGRWAPFNSCRPGCWSSPPCRRPANGAFTTDRLSPRSGRCGLRC